MTSLTDTINQIISKSFRDIPVYDLANQLLTLKNFIYASGGGGILPRKIPADDGGNLGSIRQLNTDLAYPVIRKSGTRGAGYWEIGDENFVPDNQISGLPSRGSPDSQMPSKITQSPSPGSPDSQMTSSSDLSSRLWSIVYGLWSVQDAEAAATLLNSQFTYTYDNVGNRLKMTAPNGVHNYTYNNIYELTAVTGAQSHNFTYDGVGNRTNADATTYVPNNLNQYTQVGAVNYVNDANGNLTNDGVHTFGYDVENRLITASGGQNSTYQYDGFGRRISKTVGGNTTYFVYDGDQIIEERDSSGSLLASYIYGAGIDEPLTMQRGGQNYYYFYDGLGSVTDITNANGEVVESYSYDAYGQPNITSSVGNRYMFTGREYDSETGLYYYRARMYSPTVGRFLQRDPIGYYDSMNLYAYVNNNPVNWIDPIGWEKGKSWWQQGWEWYKEQLKNPPSAKPSLYPDPYKVWAQGVPAWQATYGSRDINWRGAGREVGGMASRGYGFYREVKAAHIPGQPWTGDPRIDKFITVFNLLTTATEKLVEEIKNRQR